jgi:DNA-binding transcriptional ArsR family regulator
MTNTAYQYQPSNLHVVQTAASNYKVEKISDYFNKINEFLPLGEKLRQHHEETLKVLIKSYGKKLKTVLNNDRAIIKGIVHPEALSVSHTLNYFATCRRVSKRTIERHLKRLETAGLIIKKKIYGRVRITINSNVLHFFEQKDAKFLFEIREIRKKITKIFVEEEQKSQKFSSADNQQDKNSKTTSCRIMYISGNNINLIDTVVNGNNTVTKSVDDSETKPIDQEAPENREKIFYLNKKGRAKSEAVSREALRQKKINRLAEKLWTWTYANLYEPNLGHGIDFIAYSQERFAIRFFIDELSARPDRELIAAHEHHFNRLKAWKKHVDKINGFTPIPSVFFSHERLNLYKKTAFWLQKNNQYQQFNKCKNALSTLVRKIQKAFSSDNHSLQNKISIQEEMVARKNKIIWKEKNIIKLLHQSQLEQLDGFFTDQVNAIHENLNQAI